MQRVQRHEGDGRGAIGVGDDALVLLDVGGIDFRHDERHRFVHAEGAGVIHDHATGLGGDGCEFLGDAAARAEQRNVNARERILGEFGDGDVLALET